MPRKLLRDGVIVTDEWTYVAGAIDASAAGNETGRAESGPAADSGATPRIVSLAQWTADKALWRTAPGRLGVVLLPDHRVAELAPDLARFDLIAALFPNPSDGRGYTQGRLLRERHGFRGELRAAGYARLDQLFFLARCGFNSFELPEADLAFGHQTLHTFSAAYQPSNDAGLGFRLGHRQ